MSDFESKSMLEIDRLVEEARTQDLKDKKVQSKLLYKSAAKKQHQIAIKQMKEKSKDAVSNFFEAINLAVKANAMYLATLIVADIRKMELNEEQKNKFEKLVKIVQTM